MMQNNFGMFVTHEVSFQNIELRTLSKKISFLFLIFSEIFLSLFYFIYASDLCSRLPSHDSILRFVSVSFKRQ